MTDSYTPSLWLLLSILTMCSCVGHRSLPPLPAEDNLFEFGYWNSFVGANISVQEDGILAMRSGGLEKRKRMSSQDAEHLRAFVGSATWDEAVRWFSGNEYTPGCCDQVEFILVIDGQQLGFPVCHGGSQVPLEAQELVSMVGSVAAKYFRNHFPKEIPSTMCDSAGN